MLPPCSNLNTGAAAKPRIFFALIRCAGRHAACSTLHAWEIGGDGRHSKESASGALAQLPRFDVMQLLLRVRVSGAKQMHRCCRSADRMPRVVVVTRLFSFVFCGIAFMFF